LNIFLIAAALLLAGCAPRKGLIPADPLRTLAARKEIWAAIQPLARAHQLDPGFIYALVKLESNFDAHAQKGMARGLLQIKPEVWNEVTRLPYENLAWEWRTNLGVGVERLARLRDKLVAHGTFSYPLLWASYHYGYDYVETHGFEIERIAEPSDPVSYRIWSGDVHPLDPP
jgi:soluble lytic murein transglycosylase-like protein